MSKNKPVNGSPASHPILVDSPQSDSAESKLSQEQVCRRFFPLVRKLSNGFAFSLVIKDDLIQEGSLAILEALPRFDPTRGNSLFSYLYPQIRGKMLTFLTKEWRQVTSPVVEGQRFNLVSLSSPVRYSGTEDEDEMSLEEIVGDEGLDGNPEHNAHIASLTPAIDSACTSLPPQQRRVGRLYYWKGYRVSEIADLLRISRPRVTQLLQTALRRLKPHLAFAS